MAELKPCPFCGKTPILEDCGSNAWFIRCKCGIEQSKLYRQRCDAVKAWNKRRYFADVYTIKPGDLKDGQDVDDMFNDLVEKIVTAQAEKITDDIATVFRMYGYAADREKVLRLVELMGEEENK